MLISREKLIDLLVGQIKPGDLILLYGQIGAGKTFFTKQLCERLNIPKVQSPTFTLVNGYESTDKQWRVLHTDLYRLNSVDETIFEEIYSPECLCIIEWAEKLSDEIIGLIPAQNVYKITLFDFDSDLEFTQI